MSRNVRAYPRSKFHTAVSNDSPVTVVKGESSCAVLCHAVEKTISEENIS
jgi:hypothetical protein